MDGPMTVLEIIREAKKKDQKKNKAFSFEAYRKVFLFPRQK
jgi:hypothetical protein